jgi:hypothetical protein
MKTQYYCLVHRIDMTDSFMAVKRCLEKNCPNCVKVKEVYRFENRM